MTNGTLFRDLFLMVSIFFLAFSSGCQTSIVAKEATGANADADGLRYFLPAPYLIVEEIGDSKWDAHLELGVDRSREFYIQPKAVFAKGNTVISFNDDGTLKSFKLDADSTAVPSAVVAAAKDVKLKQLELEQAALDAAQKKKDDAKAKKDTKAASLNLKPVVGKRAFAIYRVKGEEIVGLPFRGVTPYVEGHIALATLGARNENVALDPISEIPAFPNGFTVVTSVLESTKYVMQVKGGSLAEADKAKIHFYKSANKGAEVSIPADKIEVDSGTFLVSKEVLAGVKEVWFVR